MISKQVENNIRTIAEDIFGFDLQEYSIFKKRKIYGIIYSRKKGKVKLESSFFNNDKDVLKFVEILNILSDTLKSSVAAYSTKERLLDSTKWFNKSNKAFRINLKENFDLFYLEKDLLNKSQKNVDLIIIHELCHLLVDSGYYKKIKLIPNNMDKFRGNVICRFFQSIDDSIVHNEIFCSLLCAAIRTKDESKALNEIYNALKYNFGYTSGTTKKIVINALKKPASPAPLPPKGFGK